MKKSKRVYGGVAIINSAKLKSIIKKKSNGNTIIAAQLYHKEKNIASAINNTFSNRKTKLNLEEIRNTIEMLRLDDIMGENWNNYTKKYSYARNITYIDIINTLNYLVNVLYKYQ